MKYRESLNIVNKDLQLPAILAINSSINAEESLSRVFEVLQDFRKYLRCSEALDCVCGALQTKWPFFSAGFG